MQSPIMVQTLVKAPIDAVWKSYTTPEDIVKWNAASPDWHTTRALVELREGGAFSSRMEAKDGSMGFDFAGVYTKVLPRERLEYRFGERMAAVEFVQQPDGVSVRVSFEPETTHPREDQQGGWQAILDSFGRFVEGSTQNSSRR